MAKKKEKKTNAMVVKNKNTTMVTSDNDIQSLEVQNLHLNQQDIEKLIYVIRGAQVMLDRDLAMLYGVETKALNQAVKRNINRFPEDFLFQLTQEEVIGLRSQFATLNAKDTNLKSQFVTSSSENTDNKGILISQNATSSWGGTRKLPYVFTELGISMLSSVLHSQIAVDTNIRIMRAFVASRRFFAANAQMFQQIEIVEHHQLALAAHQQDTDQRVQQILKRLDDKSDTPTQGIFFDGQFFDAISFSLAYTST